MHGFISSVGCYRGNGDRRKIIAIHRDELLLFNYYEDISKHKMLKVKKKYHIY
jgi:hypothetical protein